ncbi:MAG: 4-alpha-glucanotransferase [Chloroflexota bacterium]
MSETSLLHQLCHQHGIQTAYYDMRRHREYAPTESLLAMLRSLGAPVATLADAGPALREHRQKVWQHPLEPVIVAWDGTLAPAALRLPSNIADSTLDCQLKLETGEERRWQWNGKDHAALAAAEIGSTRYLSKPLPLPRDLPQGYHHLTVELAGRPARSLVISAPQKAYAPPDGGDKRDWGVFLPLYALRTKNNWGSGDFSDLGTLADWVAGLGGRVVATLPLLAGFFNEGDEPSPYLPISRLFWNEFYIDPSRVPELEKCPEARRLLESSSFQDEVRSFRNSSLIDYPRQVALKRRVIEEMSRTCFDEASGRLRDLQRFIAASPAAEDYARFRAAGEKHGTPWRSWPQPLRGGILREGDYREADRRYHLYGQWLAHQQVTELGRTAREKGMKLYLDLPVGVHPDGYDVWRESNAFIRDASAGAPPDAVFTRGQDWRLPPLHPEKIREQGYRYPIAYLRHHLRQAAVLRVDHVMGFHRLFCIPHGMTADLGVYLRYRAEEFYAILALESHRHRAVIVGEDLGTVPHYVRPAMKKHGLHRMYVLQYEVAGGLPGGLPPPTPDSIASLNTHDMPPFAAFWQFREIAQRRELGLLDEAGAEEARRNLSNLKRALVALLRERGWLAASEENTANIIESFLSYLAASRAEVLLVNLEDLWQETLPQNIPGTLAEYPNWRRKTRYFFEEFCQMPDVLDTLKTVDRKRRNGGHQ